MVIFHPRDNAGIYQLLHPAEIQACKLALRFKRSQLGSLLSGIKLDQNFPLVDRLAGIEVDSCDGTRKIGANHDAVDSFRCADHAHVHRPLPTLRHNAGYGFRRRLKRGGVHGRLNLPELSEAQARQQHCHHA